MSEKPIDHRPPLQTDSSDIRSRFFELYKRETDEHGRLFFQKYSDDLRNTMLFAGLLSTVGATLVTNVQPNLQPDNSATTVALLKILIRTIDNLMFSGTDLNFPEWTGPNSRMVAVQTLLQLSLTASLLAAFGALLGKQWINRYVEGKRGTIIEYCHDRQQKIEGVENRMLLLVLESLPLMLQSALFLLGVALSQYMWGVSRTVSAVIIAVTSLEILFFTFVVVSATFFHYCPFQTPLSQILRHTIEYSRKMGKSLWLDADAQFYLELVVDLVKAKGGLMESFTSSSISDSMPLANSNNALLFGDGDVHLAGNRLNARCVMWMREASTDSDVVMATMQFISEVDWTADIDAIPSLLHLATRLHEYCDLMNSFPSTVSSTRDMAYATAKAFLHLYAQRRCVKEVNQQEIFQIQRLCSFGWHDGVLDNDLESTLWMIRHMVGGSEMITWSKFNESTSVSIPHMSWISHILLYHVWASCQPDSAALADIEGLDRILKKLLSRHASLSLSTIVECIMIRGMTLGMRFDMRDLSATDKDATISGFIGKLYDQLKLLFQGIDQGQRIKPQQALEFLQYVAIWSGRVKGDCYKGPASISLCGAILDSAMDDDIKWDMARLVMQIGFRDQETINNWDGDTGVCVTFLEHHVDHEPKTHDSNPIADAFNALASRSSECDLSESNLALILCSALKNQSYTRLNRAALHFVYYMVTVTGRSQLNDPVIQQVLVDHGFSAGLKATWKGVLQGKARNDFDTDTVKEFLHIIGQLSRSHTWHPYLLDDHWDTFEYAGQDDHDWISRLLKGSYARKTFGWKALAEHVWISWKAKTCLHFPTELIDSTVNLLVLIGDPVAYGLYGVIEDVLHDLEEDLKDQVGRAKRKSAERAVQVQKMLVELLENVNEHAPDGWGDTVVSKAKVRRRKAVERMRLRRQKLRQIRNVSGPGPS